MSVVLDVDLGGLRNTKDEVATVLRGADRSADFEAGSCLDELPAVAAGFPRAVGIGLDVEHISRSRASICAFFSLNDLPNELFGSVHQIFFRWSRLTGNTPILNCTRKENVP